MKCKQTARSGNNVIVFAVKLSLYPSFGAYSYMTLQGLPDVSEFLQPHL